MAHSIALNFEDGVTRFIECRPDETIADASFRLGINIPLDCRDGVCGTCKCRVRERIPDSPRLRGHQRGRSRGRRAAGGIRKQIPGFTFFTYVPAADSARPRKGYVTAHIDPCQLRGGDVDIYLCGPPSMVDAVRAWLAEQRATPANFYYEKFSASGGQAPTSHL